MPPNDRKRLDRRMLVRGVAGTVGTLLLAGCEKISAKTIVTRVMNTGEWLSEVMQRLLGGAFPLAPEYTEADISPEFRSNGTVSPQDDDYRALAARQFVDWRLEIGGMVDRPARYSLAELRAMPSRTQITRHDCVEGWSCIAKWKGVVLGELLRQAGVQPNARYVVFYCADPVEDDNPLSKYYESVRVEEALHPQTILAYEMNDQTLSVRHGAPIRLRLELQLGYKMAKYVMRIELVDELDSIRGGKGGYWEDIGYSWYAGI